MPLVTMIVRSENNIGHVERSLNMIRRQLFADFELINVDLGSTDGTCEMIRKYNDKVVVVSLDDYRPGKVLNSMIRKCKGEIVVINDADCIPADEHWLENLIAPLLDNSGLAAVYGRQIASSGSSPLMKKDCAELFNHNSPFQDKPISLSSWAIRKEYIKKNPFDPLILSLEDLEWGVRMRQCGHSLLYAPNAVVERFHCYKREDISRLFYKYGIAEGRIYGFVSGFFPGLLLPFLREVFDDFIYLLRHGNILSIPYSLFFRWRQRYSAWKGRRDFFRN